MYLLLSTTLTDTCKQILVNRSVLNIPIGRLNLKIDSIPKALKVGFVSSVADELRVM